MWIVDTHAIKWTEKKQGETGACAHLNSKTVSAASLPFQNAFLALILQGFFFFLMGATTNSYPH